MQNSRILIYRNESQHDGIFVAKRLFVQSFSDLRIALVFDRLVPYAYSFSDEDISSRRRAPPRVDDAV